MPLTKIAKKSKDKAGLSLFPEGPKGSGPTSHEFKSMFDPARPTASTLGKFEPELMEILRAKPTEDVEGKENLKKRARQNTLGKLLGSLAQLGGVAMGGDAVRLDDQVNPFILGELENMKAMEADELARYYDEVFKTGVMNNRTINDYRSQGRQMQFQDDQLGKRQDFSREQQGEQFRFQDEQLDKRQGHQSEEARKRAKDAINQIYSRGQVSLNDAMAKKGVNPKSPNAMEEFTQRMTEEFEYDIGKPYFAPRGGVGKSAHPKLSDPDFMKKVREGREIQLNNLRQERNYIKKLPSFNAENPELEMDPKEKEAQLKYLDERIKLYEQIDVSKDDQVSLDLYEIGSQAQDQTMGPKPEQGMQYPPPNAQMGKEQVISDIAGKIETNASKIADYKNWDANTASMVKEMIDQAVEAGVFETKNEAAEQIIRGAEAFNSQK
jgi:hypothetical protein